MKILEAKIKWWEGYANTPDLHVTVDKIPRPMLNKAVDLPGRTLYFAECEGFVSFLVDVHDNMNGFGGREFTMKMEDGTERTIVGPWSGNSRIMNAAGFPTCMEAAVKEEGERISSAAALTLELAKKAIAMAGGGGVKVNEYGYYEIIR